MIKSIEMKNSIFFEWITKKFREWRGDSRKTVTDFAAFVGVSQKVMDSWINGRSVPGTENIKKISRLYPEVYDVFGIPRPSSQEVKGVDLSNLPDDFRVRLEAATAEVNSELARLGLTGNMPEAEMVTITIFEKWGFKHTTTEEVEEH